MSRRSRLARLNRLFGDARLRTSTLVTLAVVLAGGLAFHLPVSLVVVLVVAILAVAVVLRLIGSTDLGWPLRRDEASSHGWVGVAMLSHGLAVADSSPWEFDRVIRPRLTRLATAALIREGVDWDTARAREMLGGGVHDALRPDALGLDAVQLDALGPDSPAGSRPLTTAGRTALARDTLDALERLEAATTRTTQTVSTGDDGRTTA